jgi:MoaA/NifB/PqqE/SkfB family radical SAM enzyme
MSAGIGLAVQEADLYSQLKPAWHLDRIEMLRAGRVPAPVHVQLVLSDLCNQDCGFCLVAGTMIATPSGHRPIEAISVGDEVLGPDGSVVTVTETSEREVDSVIEIQVGERRILASDEHPILTQDGWKEASRIDERDSAVVRLRMHGAGDSASRNMERLCAQSSDARTPGYGEAETNGATADADKQSNEAARGSGKGVDGDEGSSDSSFRERNSVDIGSGSPENAFSRQSDARSSRSPRSPDKDNVTQSAVEERGSLYGVGVLQEYQLGIYGERAAVSGTTESRLQGSKSAQGDRSDTEGMFHEPATLAHDRDVRTSNGAALPVEAMAVTCGLEEGSSLLDSGKPGGGSSGLRIAGIELERGLALRQVTSVRRVVGRVRVYNLSCPPVESFEANDIVVHNCAYRMSAGLSGELFGTKETHNPNRRIATEKALEIIGDCAEIGVQAIQFTGGGEPTVHADHLRLFAAAQSLGIKTALVTNGVRLDAKHASVCDMEWIRVSIDAGTPETYSKIRRVSETHWHKAWSTVSALSANCKGTVGVGFVVTPDNFRELSAAAALAKQHGAKNLRIGAVFSTLGRSYYGDSISDIHAAIDEAKEVNGNGFEVVDLFGRRVTDLDGGSPSESLCGYQYMTTYIGGDLGVYRCCNTAYTRHGKMADLNGVRFKSLFGGELFEFDARSCRFCQFRGQNHVIAALAKKPQHSEFV